MRIARAFPGKAVENRRHGSADSGRLRFDRYQAAEELGAGCREAGRDGGDHGDGVIYRPDTELRSHYLEASLTHQFDAVIHFDPTRAVETLERGAE